MGSIYTSVGWVFEFLKNHAGCRGFPNLPESDNLRFLLFGDQPVPGLRYFSGLKEPGGSHGSRLFLSSPKYMYIILEDRDYILEPVLCVFRTTVMVPENRHDNRQGFADHSCF